MKKSLPALSTLHPWQKATLALIAMLGTSFLVVGSLLLVLSTALSAVTTPSKPQDAAAVSPTEKASKPNLKQPRSGATDDNPTAGKERS